MDQIELLSVLREEAAGAATVEERAQRIADLIRADTRHRWVGVYRVGDTEVVNLAWSGPAAPRHPTFAINAGLTASAIATRATVIANDVAADPRYLTNQESTGSELIVPIVVGNNVVGTLDVEDAEKNAFSAADQAFFESLAAALVPLGALSRIATAPKR
jgi:GAF domain-containing protein